MLEINKTYINGAKTRKIIEIDENKVYYVTETGKEKKCGRLCFLRWIFNGNIKCYYEISYKENDHEFITTQEIQNIDAARYIANKYKEIQTRTNIKIIEFKTTRKIVEIMV